MRGLQLLWLAAVVFPCIHTLPLPPQLSTLDSDEGEYRLFESQLSEDYFQLAQHYTTQINTGFCGVASSAMVLNALNITRPQQSGFLPQYAYFTQDNIFTNATEAVLPRSTITTQGLTLEQLAQFLAAQPGVNASFQHSDPSKVTLSQFRDSIIAALARPNQYVIVNFDRSYIHEVGSGHHSPIGAYHARTDSVLVMDVSRYKYTSFWVSLPDLFNATTSHDGSLPRGLVFVWRGMLSRDVVIPTLPWSTRVHEVRGEAADSIDTSTVVAAVSVPLFFAGLFFGAGGTYAYFMYFNKRKSSRGVFEKYSGDVEEGKETAGLRGTATSS